MNSNPSRSENSSRSPSTRRTSKTKRRASDAPNRLAKHRRLLGGLVALVLGAFAAVSLLALEPPDPLPTSAQASEFSAERAFSHVEQIAERPHPVGSAANAEVRNYLVGQLEDLGMRPAVQRATSARTKEGTASTTTNAWRSTGFGGPRCSMAVNGRFRDGTENHSAPGPIPGPATY